MDLVGGMVVVVVFGWGLVGVWAFIRNYLDSITFSASST